MNTAIRIFIPACVAFTLSGCIATKYKPASFSTPPAATLDLSAESRRAAAVVEMVIVPRGPGSWKHDALWDEYVVYVANRGAEEWIIDSAELVDADALRKQPGLDPWKLEEETASWWRRVGVDGVNDIQAGAGGTVSATVLGLYGAGAYVVGVTTGSPALAAQVLASVPVATVIPVALMANAQANVKAREAIEEKFHARQLRLPRTVKPNRVARGSLYFPVTRSPRRLILHGRADGRPLDLAVDVSAISALRGGVVPENPDRDPNDLRIVPAVPL